MLFLLFKVVVLKDENHSHAAQTTGSTGGLSEPLWGHFSVPPIGGGKATAFARCCPCRRILLTLEYLAACFKGDHIPSTCLRTYFLLVRALLLIVTALPGQSVSAPLSSCPKIVCHTCLTVAPGCRSRGIIRGSLSLQFGTATSTNTHFGRSRHIQMTGFADAASTFYQENSPVILHTVDNISPTSFRYFP